jgi:hypothetical protein
MGMRVFVTEFKGFKGVSPLVYEGAGIGPSAGAGPNPGASVKKDSITLKPDGGDDEDAKGARRQQG